MPKATFLSTAGILFLFGNLAFSSPTQEVRLSIDGTEIVTVTNQPPLLTNAVNFTTKLIAELQETISFNKNLTPNLGLRLANSRTLFPMGDGNFIVTDRSSARLHFIKEAFQQSLAGLDLSITTEGAAEPSVKHFFVSSASNGFDRTKYDVVTGPRNTSVAIGVDDQFYELGHGIMVDQTRYARYNNWRSRFTRNIRELPLSAAKVDEMVVGEGYSFAFEGLLSLGPSAYLNMGATLALEAHFNFSRIIKSGKFEIIIVKSSQNKILFSIRQAQNVGSRNFKISYGGSIGVNLNLLLGYTSSGSILSLPKNLNILAIEHSKEWHSEDRFNAVYEIDLINPGNRALYDNALSKFDFSLFDVFTTRGISTSNRLLGRFRNADLKLVLEQREHARIVTSHTSAEALLIYKASSDTNYEVAYGSAFFNNRSVQTSRGSIGVERHRSNIFTGKELESFEFKAYEEYGPQATSNRSDVILLARKVLFDSHTANRPAGVWENFLGKKYAIQKYVQDFNRFLMPDKQIIFDGRGLGDNVATTQGLMEFYITRADIRSLRRLNPADVRFLLLSSFQNFFETGSVNISTLSRTAPSSWSIAGKNRRSTKHINSLISFAVGFENLQLALRAQNKRAASQALETMLTYEKDAETYALLFRSLLIAAGREPLINIAFTNTRLQLDYSSVLFDDDAFLREGFLLSENLGKVFAGESYYDQIHNSLLERVSLQSGNRIVFNFKRNFSGFIKIVFKEKINDGGAFRNLSEFIINGENLNGRQFVFNLEGISEAEQVAAQAYSNFRNQNIRIYAALSYDDKIYDELIEVE